MTRGLLVFALSRLVKVLAKKQADLDFPGNMQAGGETRE